MVSLKRGAGFFLLLAGIFILANSHFSFTGFAVNDGYDEPINISVGLIFAIVGIFILMFGVENKVVRSRVKSDPLLLKIARTIEDKPEINKDINHLIHELNRGHTSPGLGTKYVDNGIYELRGRNGGRVYYKEVENDKYEIVGYSDKRTQEAVISRLKEKYKK